MKRLIILLTLCALCAGVAGAAEGADGWNAAKPYANAPEVNLEEQMGYIVRFPSQKLPTQTFCDRLLIYLPREDVSLGQGTLRLYKDGEAVAELAFEGGEAVSLRPITEDEQQALLWGGGCCAEILLPESLELGTEYYVLMDEGCLVTEGGVKSPAIGSPDAWRIALEGEYGVSGLTREGETIRFDLTLGGEAVSAVLYSADDSVTFEQMEFDQSSEVVGTVTGEEANWGVVFLNGDQDALDVVEPGL